MGGLFLRRRLRRRFWGLWGGRGEGIFGFMERNEAPIRVEDGLMPKALEVSISEDDKLVFEASPLELVEYAENVVRDLRNKEVNMQGKLVVDKSGKLVGGEVVNNDDHLRIKLGVDDGEISDYPFNAEKLAYGILGVKGTSDVKELEVLYESGSNLMNLKMSVNSAASILETVLDPETVEGLCLQADDLAHPDDADSGVLMAVMGELDRRAKEAY